MSSRVVLAGYAFVSFVLAAAVFEWWHIENERSREKIARDKIESNRTPPLDYGPAGASFLSDRRLSTEEIEERMSHPQVPTLAPGATILACFARVTWIRNDCVVTLHWWYEEFPRTGTGPRLRLDFDRSEHELNHQDYIGPLPAKCRPFPLPEQLTPGRRYAMVSKDTAECPGTRKYGPIYVTPPEMDFMAGAK